VTYIHGKSNKLCTFTIRIISYRIVQHDTQHVHLKTRGNSGLHNDARIKDHSSNNKPEGIQAENSGKFSLSVKTSTPLAVISTMCSYCAALDPSTVHTVQSSSFETNLSMKKHDCMSSIELSILVCSSHVRVLRSRHQHWLNRKCHSLSQRQVCIVPKVLHKR